MEHRGQITMTEPTPGLRAPFVLQYPTETAALRQAILAYVTAPAEAADAIERAQMSISIVVACDTVFNALAPRVGELDRDGAAVLAGCAEQMLVHGWMHRGAETLAVLNAAKARLEQLAPA
jgi:hypothetical protein